MKKLKLETYDIALIVVLILIFVLNIGFKFYGICNVVGGSMEPTFKDGNLLFATKNTDEINRRDIVVARADSIIPELQNSKEKLIIKRVIAIPGDTIEFKDGLVYINGKKEVMKHFVETDGKLFESESYKLKEGEYFLMGDNRPHSADSRINGPYMKNEITEKILFKIY